MKYYIDPILAECRERKAEVSAEYETWEAYSRHLDEDRPRLEAEGWKFANPQLHEIFHDENKP
jgi:hypothetical protein